MILRSRLEANIKYVVTTSYSAIKMWFLDKIDNVSGRLLLKHTNMIAHTTVPYKDDSK